jgi:hypothetical protein
VAADEAGDSRTEENHRAWSQPTSHQEPAVAGFSLGDSQDFETALEEIRRIICAGGGSHSATSASRPQSKSTVVEVYILVAPPLSSKITIGARNWPPFSGSSRLQPFCVVRRLVSGFDHSDAQTATQTLHKSPRRRELFENDIRFQHLKTLAW